MEINLKRMVSDLKKVTALNVLQEAVVNSIQANATQVEVVIEYGETLLEGRGGINKLSVTDNGDGFTEGNRKAFCEYGTEHKINLGCKGVGRVSYLKNFNTVNIKSFIKALNKTIYINFHEGFNEEKDIKEIETIEENKETRTTVEFTDPCTNDLLFPNTIEEIRDELYLHLLPLLYLKKEEDIVIYIQDKKTDHVEKIEVEDLPDFEQNEFKMKDTKGKEVDFKLHYALDEHNENAELQAFYCANDRTVQSFGKKGLSINKVNNYHIVFLLTSPFFR